MPLQLERKIVGFEMRAASEDGSEFEGYASVFGAIDDYGSILAPGAFAETLPQFLENGFIGGLNHDWDQPIGKPIEAREDAKGLFSKAQISDTSHGRDVKVLLKDGVIKKLSIGFYVKGREWLETAEAVAEYWKSINYAPTPEDIANAQYGARLYTKAHLYEYSPVTVPANAQCDITEVRNGEPASLRLDDHFLRVRDTNEEFLTRINDLADKRAADERVLPAQRRAQLTQLRDGLNSLLEASEPKAKPDQALAAKARALQADVLQYEADLLSIGGY